MGALRLPIMPEFCTCGAELPPDARFCHRCGKPQREEIVPETVARPPEVVMAVTPGPEGVPPPSAPPRVNFHNRTAVRIGLLMAGIASLLSALPTMAAGLAGLGVEYDVLPRESEILHLQFWASAFDLLKQRQAIYLESEGKNAGCWVMPEI